MGKVLQPQHSSKHFPTTGGVIEVDENKISTHKNEGDEKKNLTTKKLDHNPFTMKLGNEDEDEEKQKRSKPKTNPREREAKNQK